MTRTDSVPPAIRIENLRFTYKARSRQPAHEALRDVSMHIPTGQTVALLGPNGSGKSTLMKIICGMLEPTSGSFEAFGSSRLEDIRSVLGVVFQSEGLDPHLTVFENLRNQASLYGIPRAEARHIIGDSLDKAGLADRRNAFVKTLSKGLARRVDLCRALLHQPKVLMLDEPTVGLDPAARQAFLDLIEARREDENLTILMSTHLIDEANRQDRAILLFQGEIIADDPPAVLRRKLGRLRLTIHDGHWNPQPGDSQPWQRIGGGWRLTLDDDAEASSQLAADLARAEVPYSIAPPTLADVFEQYSGVRLDRDDSQPATTPEDAS